MAFNPKSAALEQVLLWYDGPQIVLLRAEGPSFVVAVAVDEENADDVFFGALVTGKQLIDYQSERFDLRYLLTHPGFRKWYLFSLSDEPSDIKLRPLKKTSPLVRKYLPESGFFARSHDPISTVALVTPNATETFNIDGSWDLGEFSSFYGQVEDIYYIFNGIDRFANQPLTFEEKNNLQDSFMKPFQGGGSYLSFYGDIANDNDRESLLRVSGIRYHSPGYVEVKARQEPFENLLSLLQMFAERPLKAQEAYRNLYTYLSQNKLLRAPANTFLSAPVRAAITNLSKALTEELGEIDFDKLHQMARENLLVTAKVLLSVHRRTVRLFKFFEQGRVTHEAVDVDPLDDI